MRIIVVGGSIGGLAAAIALEEAGADVLVLERRTSMEDEGTGLALRPEAVEALRSLGVTISGAPIRGWRYASVTDGRVSVRLEWSAPLTAYTYGAVRAALLARAAGIEIRTGARVSTVETQGQGARVSGDGIELDADLVVAADGVDSLARRALFPDVHAEPMGIVMWRGFVREEDARETFGADVLDGFSDVNTQLFASSAKGWWLGILVPERTAGAGRRFVWISYMRAEDAAIDALCTDADGVYRQWGTAIGKASSAARSSLREELRARFPAPISTLADIGMVSVHRVAKMLVPAMARGRVCLVGDAAHVAPPFTTAGATLAIADGVGLARALACGTVNDAALEAWSAERLGAVRAIHAQAEAIARHTIDHPPELASASPDDLTAWARGFLPPNGARTLQVVDRALWTVPSSAAS